MSNLSDIILEYWELVVKDQLKRTIVQSTNIRSFLKVVPENNALVLCVSFKKEECTRIELIEVNPVDGSHMYWHIGTASKYLSVELKFKDICNGVSLILCHLDGYQRDIQPFQIRYSCWEGKGFCNILYKSSPDECPKLKCLVSNIPIDSTIYFSVDIALNGKVSVTINNISIEFDLDRRWNAYSLRFITGIRVDEECYFYPPLKGQVVTAVFNKISLTKK
jgi:hypothetical protein